MNSRYLPSRGQKLAAGAIAVLLAGQLYGLAQFLSSAPGSSHHLLMAVTVAAVVLTPVAAFGIWMRQTWAGWGIVLLLTWNATVDLWAWSVDRSEWGLAGLAANTVVFLLFMWLPAAELSKVTPAVRIYFVAVAALTTHVAFWGLLFPTGTGLNWQFMAKGFDDAMPFAIPVPTLHARFIGALYLGATAGCVLNIFARDWRAAWLGTWMMLLWTGSLLGVTLLHLDAFDWRRSPVWFWYAAYVGFPVAAAWILKRRGNLPADPTGVPLSTLMRLWLTIQGLALIAIAGVLFFSPALTAAIWPWKIGPLLSQIYSGPSLTFGVASLIAAASCQSRRETRVLVFAATVLGTAALIASFLHHDRFNFAGPSAWVWFTSLTAMALVNAAILLWPSRTIASPPFAHASAA